MKAETPLYYADMKAFAAMTVEEAFHAVEFQKEQFDEKPEQWFIMGLLYGYPYYTSLSLWDNRRRCRALKGR